ncbi:MAG: DUF2141 domain-containing protein [Candidatus Caenarcaniphilales bacterium]|nr:DUF2141 domain-containing protein [Candidatus Caenarcaniphilales bacterium]
MKRPFLFLYIALVLCSCSLAEAAQVTVKIKNVKKNAGNVKVGLFTADKQADFPNGKAFMEKTVPANASELSAVFDSVAYGTYAVGAFNDENKNSKLDKVLGIPKEAYGNSGKYTKTEPKFVNSKFQIGKEDELIEFPLH